MKKILTLLIISICLYGCMISFNKQEDSIHGIGSEDGFKTVNVAGMFDVQIKDPLPEQMNFCIYNYKSQGCFYFHISSSNPDCIDSSKCMAISDDYVFQWYTAEELEKAKLSGINLSDENFVKEIDSTIGKLYIYKALINRNNEWIENPEEKPVYLHEDGTIDYKIDELIKF